jgi:signal transduction histidine kinase
VDKTISELPDLPLIEYLNTRITKRQTMQAVTPRGINLVNITPIILDDGRLIGYLYIVTGTQRIRQERTVLTLVFVTGTLLCVLATSIVIFLSFYRTIFARITDTMDTVRHVAQGDLSSRVRGTIQPDEIGVLQQGVNSMIGSLEQRIEERDRAERDLRLLNEELEQRVTERTAELESANKELEAFSYSVSHDLRAPLRSVDGFSQALVEDYADKLDEKGIDCLRRIRSSTQRMSSLIDDMLRLSRVGRTEMRVSTVNLSAIAWSFADERRRAEPERKAEFVIAPDMAATGDPELLEIVVMNLLDNAWKFTSHRDVAQIEFGVTEQEGEKVYYVRDNGVGFDMRYVDKLFKPFHRLHTATEFPGTGIGLAIVQRIVYRHGGKAWAEAAVGQGATFYFTLQLKNE